METLFSFPLAIAAAFIWTGLILGISFLEAWLKFKAPGVTTALGLSIGRLVFRALNRIEWVFAIVLAVSVVIQTGYSVSVVKSCLLVIVVLLVLQTAWLLPALDARAQRVIDNRQVESSRIHIAFITAELAKVALLLTVGITLLKNL